MVKTSQAKRIKIQLKGSQNRFTVCITRLKYKNPSEHDLYHGGP